MPALLDVENLSVGTRKRMLLCDVSLRVEEGEVWGIVGASGAGKSILARSISALLPRGVAVAEGRILYRGEDWLGMKETEKVSIRGSGIGYLVQNTSSGLDPVYTVEQQMTEALLSNGAADSRGDAVRISISWLKKVGLRDVSRVLSSYPHTLSGGMAQRVYLAMVFMLKPKLVIADEFSSGLDSTTEKKMMSLLLKVAENSGMIMITHNIFLLGGITDKTAVMNGGMIVESGPTEKILETPLHGYSQVLLKARHQEGRSLFRKLNGRADCRGCPFAERCGEPMEQCFTKIPDVREVDGRKVRCHRY
ncbi:MAG: ABC transporter ATP-binding protein [Acidobacteria bacterium]|nr:ABC transporter ATP-binding protein [Acidobacteriota bacterium]